MSTLILPKKERNTNKKIIDFPVDFIPLQLDTNYLLQNHLSSDNIKGDRGKVSVRMDTNEIIAVVTQEYGFIKHIQMVNNLEKTLHQAGIPFSIFDINMSGKCGNRVYINYTIPSYSFTIEGDSYVPFIHLYSSHDHDMSHGIFTGFYRQECENACIMTKGLTLLKKRHRQKYFKVDEEDMLDIGHWIANVSNARRSLSGLLSKSFDALDVTRALDKVFNRKKYRNHFLENEILKKSIKKFGDNQYALFNALTEYATHFIVREDRVRSYDTSRKSQIAISKLFLSI